MVTSVAVAVGGIAFSDAAQQLKLLNVLYFVALCKKWSQNPPLCTCLRARPWELEIKIITPKGLLPQDNATSDTCFVQWNDQSQSVLWAIKLYSSPDPRKLNAYYSVHAVVLVNYYPNANPILHSLLLCIAISVELTSPTSFCRFLLDLFRHVCHHSYHYHRPYWNFLFQFKLKLFTELLSTIDFWQTDCFRRLWTFLQCCLF